MPPPAILVDRDGVLVDEVAFLSRPDQVRALPGVGPVIQRAHRAGLRVVVCTNQPVVARGDVTLEGLEAIHQTLDAQLRATGDAPDAYLVCPHHPAPETTHPNRAFVTPCDCRKPLPGLLLRAAREGGLTHASTVYVGDRTTDLLAAQRAGMVGVGVTTGYACRDGKHPLLPEVALFPSLAEAFTLPLVTALSPTLQRFAQRVEKGSVVLLGGPSRAGKTVLANALRLVLSQAGHTVVHVSLDRFIQPACRRPPDATLAQRLGHAHAELMLTALLRDGYATTPLYDPSTREDAGTADVDLPRNAVLLLDGILANTLEPTGPTVRVHVDAPVELRRARRHAFYVWKGLTGAALAHSVDGRTDEEALLPQLAARAHTVLTLHNDGAVSLVREG